MRQSDLRTLAAREVEVGVPVRIRGIECHEALNSAGEKLLIFSGSPLGPSWVSFGFWLDKHGIEYRLMFLSRTFLLSVDNPELRQLLKQVHTASKLSTRSEVLVEDVGFLTSHLKKKFDVRILIPPGAVLSLIVLGAFFPLSEPATELEILDSEPAISCALDLPERDFRSWLNLQVSDKSKAAIDQLVIETELGTLSLIIQQTLGSAQLIYGTLGCQDGRLVEMQFRTDSQHGGNLVELGERLDP